MKKTKRKTNKLICILLSGFFTFYGIPTDINAQTLSEQDSYAQNPSAQISPEEAQAEYENLQKSLAAAAQKIQNTLIGANGAPQKGPLSRSVTKFSKNRETSFDFKSTEKEAKGTSTAYLASMDGGDFETIVDLSYPESQASDLSEISKNANETLLVGIEIDGQRFVLGANSNEFNQVAVTDAFKNILEKGKILFTFHTQPSDGESNLIASYTDKLFFALSPVNYIASNGEFLKIDEDGNETKISENKVFRDMQKEARSPYDIGKEGRDLVAELSRELAEAKETQLKQNYLVASVTVIEGVTTSGNPATDLPVIASTTLSGKYNNYKDSADGVKWVYDVRNPEAIGSVLKIDRTGENMDLGTELVIHAQAEENALTLTYPVKTRIKLTDKDFNLVEADLLITGENQAFIITFADINAAFDSSSVKKIEFIHDKDIVGATNQRANILVGIGNLGRNLDAIDGQDKGGEPTTLSNLPTATFSGEYIGGRNKSAGLINGFSYVYSIGHSSFGNATATIATSSGNMTTDGSFKLWLNAQQADTGSAVPTYPVKATVQFTDKDGKIYAANVNILAEDKEFVFDLSSAGLDFANIKDIKILHTRDLAGVNTRVLLNVGVKGLASDSTVVTGDPITNAAPSTIGNLPVESQSGRYLAPVYKEGGVEFRYTTGHDSKDQAIYTISNPDGTMSVPQSFEFWALAKKASATPSPELQYPVNSLLQFTDANGKKYAVTLALEADKKSFTINLPDIGDLDYTNLTSIDWVQSQAIDPTNTRANIEIEVNGLLKDTGNLPGAPITEAVSSFTNVPTVAVTGKFGNERSNDLGVAYAFDVRHAASHELITTIAKEGSTFGLDDASAGIFTFHMQANELGVTLTPPVKTLVRITDSDGNVIAKVLEVSAELLQYQIDLNSNFNKDSISKIEFIQSNSLNIQNGRGLMNISLVGVGQKENVTLTKDFRNNQTIKTTLDALTGNPIRQDFYRGIFDTLDELKDEDLFQTRIINSDTETLIIDKRNGVAKRYTLQTTIGTDPLKVLIATPVAPNGDAIVDETGYSVQTTIAQNKVVISSPTTSSGDSITDSTVHTLQHQLDADTTVIGTPVQSDGTPNPGDETTVYTTQKRLSASETLISTPTTSAAVSDDDTTHSLQKTLDDESLLIRTPVSPAGLNTADTRASRQRLTDEGTVIQAPVDLDGTPNDDTQISLQKSLSDGVTLIGTPVNLDGTEKSDTTYTAQKTLEDGSTLIATPVNNDATAKSETVYSKQKTRDDGSTLVSTPVKDDGTSRADTVNSLQSSIKLDLNNDSVDETYTRIDSPVSSSGSDLSNTQIILQRQLVDGTTLIVNGVTKKVDDSLDLTNLTFQAQKSITADHDDDPDTDEVAFVRVDDSVDVNGAALTDNNRIYQRSVENSKGEQVTLIASDVAHDATTGVPSFTSAKYAAQIELDIDHDNDPDTDDVKFIRVDDSTDENGNAKTDGTNDRVYQRSATNDKGEKVTVVASNVSEDPLSFAGATFAAQIELDIDHDNDPDTDDVKFIRVDDSTDENGNAKTDGTNDRVYQRSATNDKGEKVTVVASNVSEDPLSFAGATFAAQIELDIDHDNDPDTDDVKFIRVDDSTDENGNAKTDGTNDRVYQRSATNDKGEKVTVVASNVSEDPLSFAGATFAAQIELDIDHDNDPDTDDVKFIRVDDSTDENGNAKTDGTNDRVYQRSATNDKGEKVTVVASNVSEDPLSFAGATFAAQIELDIDHDNDPDTDDVKFIRVDDSTDENGNAKTDGTNDRVYQRSATNDKGEKVTVVASNVSEDPLSFAGATFAAQIELDIDHDNDPDTDDVKFIRVDDSTDENGNAKTDGTNDRVYQRSATNDKGEKVTVVASNVSEDPLSFAGATFAAQIELDIDHDNDPDTDDVKFIRVDDSTDENGNAKTDGTNDRVYQRSATNDKGEKVTVVASNVSEDPLSFAGATFAAQIELDIDHDNDPDTDDVKFIRVDDSTDENGNAKTDGTNDRVYQRSATNDKGEKVTVVASNVSEDPLSFAGATFAAQIELDIDHDNDPDTDDVKFIRVDDSTDENGNAKTDGTNDRVYQRSATNDKGEKVTVVASNVSEDPLSFAGATFAAQIELDIDHDNDPDTDDVKFIRVDDSTDENGNAKTDGTNDRVYQRSATNDKGEKVTVVASNVSEDPLSFAGATFAAQIELDIDHDNDPDTDDVKFIRVDDSTDENGNAKTDGTNDRVYQRSATNDKGEKVTVVASNVSEDPLSFAGATFAAQIELDIDHDNDPDTDDVKFIRVDDSTDENGNAKTDGTNDRVYQRSATNDKGEKVTVVASNVSEDPLSFAGATFAAQIELDIDHDNDPDTDDVKFIRVDDSTDENGNAKTDGTNDRVYQRSATNDKGEKVTVVASNVSEDPLSFAGATFAAQIELDIDHDNDPDTDDVKFIRVDDSTDENGNAKTDGTNDRVYQRSATNDKGEKVTVVASNVSEDPLSFAGATFAAQIELDIDHDNDPDTDDVKFIRVDDSTDENGNAKTDGTNDRVYQRSATNDKGEKVTVVASNVSEDPLSFAGATFAAQIELDIDHDNDPDTDDVKFIRVDDSTDENGNAKTDGTNDRVYQRSATNDKGEKVTVVASNVSEDPLSFAGATFAAQIELDIDHDNDPDTDDVKFIRVDDSTDENGNAKTDGTNDRVYQRSATNDKGEKVTVVASNVSEDPLSFAGATFAAQIELDIDHDNDPDTDDVKFIRVDDSTDENGNAKTDGTNDRVYQRSATNDKGEKVTVVASNVSEDPLSFAGATFAAQIELDIDHDNDPDTDDVKFIRVDDSTDENGNAKTDGTNDRVYQRSATNDKGEKVTVVASNVSEDPLSFAGATFAAQIELDIDHDNDPDTDDVKFIRVDDSTDENGNAKTDGTNDRVYQRSATNDKGEKVTVVASNVSEDPLSFAGATFAAQIELDIDHDNDPDTDDVKFIRVDDSTDENGNAKTDGTNDRVYQRSATNDKGEKVTVVASNVSEDPLSFAGATFAAQIELDIDHDNDPDTDDVKFIRVDDSTDENGNAKTDGTNDRVYQRSATNDKGEKVTVVASNVSEDPLSFAGATFAAQIELDIDHDNDPDTDDVKFIRVDDSTDENGNAKTDGTNDRVYQRSATNDKGEKVTVVASNVSEDPLSFAGATFAAQIELDIDHDNDPDTDDVKFIRVDDSTDENGNAKTDGTNDRVYQRSATNDKGEKVTVVASNVSEDPLSFAGATFAAQIELDIDHDNDPDTDDVKFIRVDDSTDENGNAKTDGTNDRVYQRSATNDKGEKVTVVASNVSEDPLSFAGATFAAQIELDIDHDNDPDTDDVKFIRVDDSTDENGNAKTDGTNDRVYQRSATNDKGEKVTVVASNVSEDPLSFAGATFAAQIELDIDHDNDPDTDDVKFIRVDDSTDENGNAKTDGTNDRVYQRSATNDKGEKVTVVASNVSEDPLSFAGATFAAQIELDIDHDNDPDTDDVKFIRVDDSTDENGNAKTDGTNDRVYQRSATNDKGEKVTVVASNVSEDPLSFAGATFAAQIELDIDHDNDPDTDDVKFIRVDDSTDENGNAKTDGTNDRVYQRSATNDKGEKVTVVASNVSEDPLSFAGATFAAQIELDIDHDNDPDTDDVKFIRVDDSTDENGNAKTDGTNDRVYQRSATNDKGEKVTVVASNVSEDPLSFAGATFAAQIELDIDHDNDPDTDDVKFIRVDDSTDENGNAKTDGTNDRVYQRSATNDKGEKVTVVASNVSEDPLSFAGATFAAQIELDIDHDNDPDTDDVKFIRVDDSTDENGNAKTDGTNDRVYQRSATNDKGEKVTVVASNVSEDPLSFAGATFAAQIELDIDHDNDPDTDDVKFIRVDDSTDENGNAKTDGTNDRVYQRSATNDKGEKVTVVASNVSEDPLSFAGATFAAQIELDIDHDNDPDTDDVKFIRVDDSTDENGNAKTDGTNDRVYQRSATNDKGEKVTVVASNVSEDPLSFAGATFAAQIELDIDHDNDPDTDDVKFIRVDDSTDENGNAKTDGTNDRVYQRSATNDKGEKVTVVASNVSEDPLSFAGATFAAQIELDIDHDNDPDTDDVKFIRVDDSTDENGNAKTDGTNDRVYQRSATNDKGEKVTVVASNVSEDPLSFAGATFAAQIELDIDHDNDPDTDDVKFIRVDDSTDENGNAKTDGTNDRVYQRSATNDKGEKVTVVASNVSEDPLSFAGATFAAQIELDIDHDNDPDTDDVKFIRVDDSTDENGNAKTDGTNDRVYQRSATNDKGEKVTVVASNVSEDPLSFAGATFAAQIELDIDHDNDPDTDDVKFIRVDDSTDENGNAKTDGTNDRVYQRSATNDKGEKVTVVASNVSEDPLSFAGATFAAQIELDIDHDNDPDTDDVKFIRVDDSTDENGNAKTDGTNDRVYQRSATNDKGEKVTVVASNVSEDPLSFAGATFAAQIELDIDHDNDPDTDDVKFIRVDDSTDENGNAKTDGTNDRVYQRSVKNSAGEDVTVVASGVTEDPLSFAGATFAAQTTVKATIGGNEVSFTRVDSKTDAKGDPLSTNERVYQRSLTDTDGAQVTVVASGVTENATTGPDFSTATFTAQKGINIDHDADADTPNEDFTLSLDPSNDDGSATATTTYSRQKPLDDGFTLIASPVNADGTSNDFTGYVAQKSLDGGRTLIKSPVNLNGDFISDLTEYSTQKDLGEIDGRSTRLIASPVEEDGDEIFETTEYSLQIALPDTASGNGVQLIASNVTSEGNVIPGETFYTRQETISVVKTLISTPVENDGGFKTTSSHSLQERLGPVESLIWTNVNKDADPIAGTSTTQSIYAQDTDGDLRIDIQDVYDATCTITVINDGNCSPLSQRIYFLASAEQIIHQPKDSSNPDSVDQTIHAFYDEFGNLLKQIVYEGALAVSIDDINAKVGTGELVRSQTIHFIEDAPIEVTSAVGMSLGDISPLPGTINEASFGSGSVSFNGRGADFTFNTTAPADDFAAGGFAYPDGTPGDISTMQQLAFGIQRTAGDVESMFFTVEDADGDKVSMRVNGINTNEQIFTFSTADLERLNPLLDLDKIKIMFFEVNGVGVVGGMKINRIPNPVQGGDIHSNPALDLRDIQSKDDDFSAFDVFGGDASATTVATDRGINLTYNTGSTTFSGGGLSYTPAVDFSTLNQFVIGVEGISGNTDRIKIEFEDGSGRKSSLRIDGVVDGEENVFSISLESLLGDAALTDIKAILFIVEGVGKAGQVAINFEPQVVSTPRAQLIEDHKNNQTLKATLGSDGVSIVRQDVYAGIHSILGALVRAQLIQQIVTEGNEQLLIDRANNQTVHGFLNDDGETVQQDVYEGVYYTFASLDPLMLVSRIYFLLDNPNTQLIQTFGTGPNGLDQTIKVTLNNDGETTRQDIYNQLASTLADLDSGNLFQSVIFVSATEQLLQIHSQGITLQRIFDGTTFLLTEEHIYSGIIDATDGQTVLQSTYITSATEQIVLDYTVAPFGQTIVFTFDGTTGALVKREIFDELPSPDWANFAELKANVLELKLLNTIIPLTATSNMIINHDDHPTAAGTTWVEHVDPSTGGLTRRDIYAAIYNTADDLPADPDQIVIPMADGRIMLKVLPTDSDPGQTQIIEFKADGSTCVDIYSPVKYETGNETVIMDTTTTGLTLDSQGCS